MSIPTRAVRLGHEHARILERRPGRQVGAGGRSIENDFFLIALPMRDGAGGNKVVAFSELIDASALTAEEEREFHDLDRAQAGWVGKDGRLIKRLSAGQKAKRARRDSLRSRIIRGPLLDRLLRFARATQQRRAA
jgi:hypothetical protein